MSRKHKRTFTYLVSTGARRGFEFFPSRVVTSNLRIRAVAAILWEKWFGGRKSKFAWGKDGFMAEVHGHDGAYVQVEQENHYHRFSPGATRQRRPLCPMIVPRLSPPAKLPSPIS